MGGKVWSEEEERVFWEVIIPQSPNAANPATRTLTWKACCVLMKRLMGQNARRQYTGTMLYEHHYQNFKPGPKSPKANKFLAKYMADIERYTAKPAQEPESPVPSTVIPHQNGRIEDQASVPPQAMALVPQLPADAPGLPIQCAQYGYLNTGQFHELHRYTSHRDNVQEVASFRPRLPPLVIPSDAASSYGLGRPVGGPFPAMEPARERRLMGMLNHIDPILRNTAIARNEMRGNTGQETSSPQSSSAGLGVVSRSTTASRGTTLSSSLSPTSDSSRFATPASISPAVEAIYMDGSNQQRAANPVPQVEASRGDTQKRKRTETEDTEEYDHVPKRRTPMLPYGHRSPFNASATRSVRHPNVSGWRFQPRGTDQTGDAEAKLPEETVDSEKEN